LWSLILLDFNSPQTLEPSTCACLIEMDSDPYVEADAILLERCRTHNTAQEAITHNRSLSTQTPERRELERQKPEFQRR